MKAIFIAVITGIFLALLASSNVFFTWNLKLTDSLYGSQKPNDNIVIIGIDDKSLQEIGRWPWDRTAYVPILEKTKSAKVVGFDISFFEPTESDSLFQSALSDNVILAKEFDFKTNNMMNPVFTASTGVVNIYTEQDGISRSIPKEINNESSFALEIATKYLGTKPSSPDTILVNFASKPYKTISAIDVINNDYDFTNKIVLIGATAPDLHDFFITPVSKKMPGVEVNANAVQTVLTQSYLHRQNKVSIILTIILISLLVGALFTLLSIWQAGTLLFLIFIAYIFVAIKSFNQGIILNIIYPSLTILLTALTSITYKAIIEAKNKKHILNLFGKYVSKDVVKFLLKNEKAVELGGEERDVTAFFADIRGFTAMSEKLTPHEVIKVLNHYFGDMTDIIFEHGGTLDKYIGDCLFAIWGSPLFDENHAEKAIKCALHIQKRLKEQHTEGIPKIDLGIGVCSGPAVVGNMGSPQRQEFTAIGDTINTASRLSGIASGGEIVITESTYHHIKDKFKFKKLEPIKVKGKEKPLQIYMVLE